RFEDLASNLGAPMLRTVVERLLDQGDRDRERAFMAAEALEPLLPENERTPLWLHVAERCGGSDDPAALELERRALDRAAAIPGPETYRALERLHEVLVDLDDSERLIPVLRRRIEIERSAERRR